MTFTLRLTAIVIACFGVWSTLHAQVRPRILVLPFRPVGSDTSSAQTIASLMRSELDRIGKHIVIEAGRTPDRWCEDVDCAMDAGRDATAAIVVYGSLGRLGEKYVLSYSVADVIGGGRTKSGERSSWSVEELENAARSAAAEIAGGSTTESANEANSRSVGQPNRVLNRRYDTVSIGIGFGQLYPTNGFSGIERAFVFDTRFSIEHPSYSFDALIAWRLGPLINLGASYLFTNDDISPYVGVGFGYHLTASETVADTNGYYYDDPDLPDGSFQLMARVGTWVLRKSSIRIFVNVDYLWNIEEGKQKAVTLTLGLAGVTDQLRLF